MFNRIGVYSMTFLLAGALLLPAGAQAGPATPTGTGLAQRVAALEAQAAALQGLLACVTTSTATINGLAGPHILITGCNLHIRSGSGTTDDNTTFLTGGDGTGTLTGLGNLVIGYNEAAFLTLAPGDRGGSHNLVVGSSHKYSGAAGLVAGVFNTVSGDFASVSGARATPPPAAPPA